MNNHPVRVLLVDDHCMFLDALRSALNSVPKFQVVGTATNAEEALHLAEELSPDVVVCDMEFPGSSGILLAAELHRRMPKTRTAVLSGFFSPARLESALKAHVHGYLLKTDAIEDLVVALENIANGQTHFSASIRDALTTDSAGKIVVKGTTGVADLSPLQLEILRHLALGLSVKQVAKLMHVTTKAIDNQKNRIMQRLDIHDRVLLARFAIEQGLIPQDPTPAVA